MSPNLYTLTLLVLLR
jgi:hypothetical protein